MGRIVIKKYGNRRLYDTAASRYVNLVDIAEMVRKGKDVSVIDAKSGEDLTRVTLTQIIVEDAKEQEGGLPLEFLRQVIVASNKVAHEGFMWFKPALNAVEDFSPVKMMKKLVGGERSDIEDLRGRIAELEKRAESNARRVAKKKRSLQRTRRNAKRNKRSLDSD